MAAITHSIWPGYVPVGYFDKDNVDFIVEKVSGVLEGEFHQRIIIDGGSIKRVMMRVLGERLETIPRMNQRVIMYLCNEFRVNQAEAKRNSKWEGHYIESQRLYDPTVERGPTTTIKTKNRLGKDRVGGTMRFVFF